MVKFILKYLNKIKQLFVIIPLLIAAMVFVGLFFANKKSEPEFASKTERIMFETKNKSPKYVITLPSQQETPKETKVVEKNVEVVVSQEILKPQSKTNNEKLSNLDIPLLSRLPVSQETATLDYVESLSNLLETNDKEQQLPISDGQLYPWEIYGRKVSVLPMFNKVVVVFKNIGANKYNTDLMIDRLSPNISLSFSPYASDLPKLIEKARQRGHETYLDMILPSRDFSKTDTGPQALDFNKKISENIDLLEAQLSGDFVVGGFTVNDGVDDAEYNDYFQAVMTMLAKRGLLLFDSMQGKALENNNVLGLARARADIVIDKDFSRQSIREKLVLAEQYAFRNGNVIIAADSKPVVVLEIVNWLQTFSKQLSYEEMKEKGITSFEKPLVLVPLSNLVGEY